MLIYITQYATYNKYNSCWRNRVRTSRGTPVLHVLTAWLAVAAGCSHSGSSRDHDRCLLQCCEKLVRRPFPWQLVLWRAEVLLELPLRTAQSCAPRTRGKPCRSLRDVFFVRISVLHCRSCSNVACVAKPLPVQRFVQRNLNLPASQTLFT